MKNYFILLFTVTGMLCAYSSCRKDDYRDFTKGGELVYSSKMEDVIVASGKNRLQLKLITKSDPSLDFVRIFWNNNQDSVDVSMKLFEQSSHTIYIGPLEDGNYNFKIYTYDKEGHISVPFSTFGVVYGDSYANSLTSRIIKSSEALTQDSLKLYWGRASVGEIGTLIKYLNSKNDSVSVILPRDSSNIILSDYKENTSYIYQSLFKPESNFVDTFYTSIAEVQFPVSETEVDKTKLSIFKLPTDKDDAHGWRMEYLWDENYGTPGMATQDGTEQWFTIDLSEPISLTRLKMWQASDRLYAKENVKKFEVWGSNTPDLEGTWESWTHIMSCESFKPSGLPIGENSPEDIQFATNGENFEFPNDTAPYRYLRFKLLTNWGGAKFMTIGEISLWQKSE